MQDGTKKSLRFRLAYMLDRAGIRKMRVLTPEAKPRLEPTIHDVLKLLDQAHERHVRLFNAFRRHCK